MVYHLIWTCYGQWLSGDERGYVDDGQNRPGSRYPADNGALLNAMANRMVEAPVWLSDPQRLAADAALREACDFRGWSCLELNVQPDHVHIAVRAGEETGESVRRKLKGRASMALNRRFGRRRSWWSEGGKVVVVQSEQQLRDTLAYVRDQPFPPVRGPNLR